MHVIKQKKSWDCGVASLTMLLDIPYKDVMQAVRDIINDPKLKQRGLILRQMEELLHHFGFKTRRVYRKDGYLDGANGILGLNGGDCDPAGHWVVLKDGVIVDPSGGDAYSVEEYLKEFGCRPATLLVID